MTSKKYIIQPLSLPPPTRHTQNGSRTIALLAKNSKSLHALGPSDVKKRDKESNPSLPCSIGTASDQHVKELDGSKKSPGRTNEKDLKELPPIALETDLKDFRDYLKNEKNATPGFVTPFQNVTSNGNEDNKVDETATETSGDFSTWIREMNTKIITKKRQIRTEKKRAEREKQPSSTLSSSPTTSPSLPKKQKYTLFQLRKKKTKKDDYDTLGGPTKREVTPMHPTKTPTDNGSKSKNQSTPTGNFCTTDNGNNPKSKSSEKLPEPRLFQIVRPRTDEEEEKPTTPRGYTTRSPVSTFDDTSSNSSSSSSASSSFKVSKFFGKSKSFSFMKSSSTPRTPRTLAPSHHSEHDMRAKRLPRNVVSVSVSS